MTPTNINFTPKKYAGGVGLDRSPSPARKLPPSGTPAQPRKPRPFAPLQEKKTLGRKVRRTPDVKLRFVGFIRFVGFNFGHVQLLRFVVVMVWSYSFGHLGSVKLIFLNKAFNSL